MAKGGSFEREVADDLSEWWMPGRHDIFYRTPGSGGRFTSRTKAGKSAINQEGDQLASDPIGQPLMDDWSVECKTGYGSKKAIKHEGVVVKKVQERWDALDFLDSRQEKPVLQKMWEQCYRDALLANKEPILIFRRNGRHPCIMFRTRYQLYLQDFFGDYLNYHIILRTAPNLNCVVMPLDLFFDWIPDIRPALRGKRPTINLRRV